MTSGNPQIYHQDEIGPPKILFSYRGLEELVLQQHAILFWDMGVEGHTVEKGGQGKDRSKENMSGALPVYWSWF